LIRAPSNIVGFVQGVDDDQAGRNIVRLGIQRIITYALRRIEIDDEIVHLEFRVVHIDHFPDVVHFNPVKVQEIE
jgi:hypothetical protein